MTRGQTMTRGSRARRATLASVLAISMSAVPTLAQAAPSLEQQVEAINAAAVEKFKAKEYEEAVVLFEQAYDLQPEPNYLFNIGRIYEESGNLEKAAEFYERFIKEPGVPIEARERANERRRVLRKLPDRSEEGVADLHIAELDIVQKYVFARGIVPDRQTQFLDRRRTVVQGGHVGDAEQTVLDDEVAFHSVDHGAILEDSPSRSVESRVLNHTCR
jgi:tetratricopeptide (TPR) repeat protein